VSGILAPREGAGEFRKRYRWLSLVAFLGFLAVVIRLCQLQLVQGSDYAQIAHENIIRRVSIPTTRGMVRDSKGKVLASSRPSYNVYIIPGRVMPSARPVRHRRREPGRDTFDRVAEVLRLNPEEKRKLVERVRNSCQSV